ncbi:putative toxin-antitoxin system toxin component, PIN family [Jatrophihabitans endophyticus]|uniref:putative toxin-antitoxin system toxin component, PIN family n=1 Tax=Jatrophihabitans endophyticus TaxID=1206085 RepID=UPI0019D85318|nr:putative toxin-antitoxin system toxin component, PIN family [Jatrophihabitans endophyticus]MBE7188191.1 putative toxin-antitoxin system toxin component, PIN family [Jatrophihabitans endophyticus]
MTAPLSYRVVLDPNVLVSAAITPMGTLGRVVSLVDSGIVVPIASQHLIDEVTDVLGRPKLRRYVDPEKAQAFIAELGRLAEWHADPVDPPSLCRDPDDDYLLALAVLSRVDALVSGDQDLHALDNPGVDVITPRVMLDRFSD